MPTSSPSRSRAVHPAAFSSSPSGSGHRAGAGRPGAQGGIGAAWAPRRALTDEDLRKQIRDSTTIVPPPPAVGVPHWLRTRPDFAPYHKLAEAVAGAATAAATANKAVEAAVGTGTGGPDSAGADLAFYTACARPPGTRSRAELALLQAFLRPLRAFQGVDALALETVARNIELVSSGSPGDSAGVASSSNSHGGSGGGLRKNSGGFSAAGNAGSPQWRQMQRGSVSFSDEEGPGLRSGHVLCRQGERGEDFFVVVAGRVEISVSGLGVMDLLARGSCFGELALTFMQCRQATARAMAPLPPPPPLSAAEASALAAAPPLSAAQQAQHLRQLQAQQRAQVLRLSREIYIETVAPARTRWVMTLVDFLASLPLFTHWSKNRLRRLAMVMKAEQVLPGDEVVQQGTLPDRALLVFAGELQLVHYSERFGENRWPVVPHEAAEERARQLQAQAEAREAMRAPSPNPSRAASAERQRARSAGARAAAAKFARKDLNDAALASLLLEGTDGGGGGGATMMLDLSGHFPMGVRRTRTMHCEPIGEVTVGACLGFDAIARNYAQPFSLVAKSTCTLISLSSKYLRPNAMAGFDIADRIIGLGLAVDPTGLQTGLNVEGVDARLGGAGGAGLGGGGGNDSDSDSDSESELCADVGLDVDKEAAAASVAAATRRARGRLASRRGLKKAAEGDEDDGGGASDPSLALPESRFLQVLTRADPTDVVAGAIALAPPGSSVLKPKEDLGGGSGRGKTGQDELGLVFPSSGTPQRRPKPLTPSEIEEVLVHVVSLQESASDQEEENRLQRLLLSLAGPGIALYPTASAFLRGFRMASKNMALTQRLVLGRGELLRQRLSLDEHDSEKLLRHMLTACDDACRVLSQHLEEGDGGGSGGDMSGAQALARRHSARGLELELEES